MGLMDFIRQNLPESWDKAATEMKMKTELITRLHANVPRTYKNKYHYKEGIRYILGVFKTKSSIYYHIDATNLDFEKWKQLDNKIKEYEYLCDQFLGGFGLNPNKKKESSRNSLMNPYQTLTQWEK